MVRSIVAVSIFIFTSFFSAEAALSEVNQVQNQSTELKEKITVILDPIEMLLCGTAGGRECGDGILEEGEQCEHDIHCSRNQYCIAGQCVKAHEPRP